MGKKPIGEDDGYCFKSMTDELRITGTQYPGKRNEK